ncbi:MAG: prepilin-type N-terminal cleavage/methylation domain-containing protein [Tissierellia bacterium]|nr:prepilin-type N-terminal cleavage/methylation domain-containing protein [Tissierellia bacterium]
MKPNWNCNSPKKIGGFTLIELLLALFIATLVVTSFAMLFDYGIRAAEFSGRVDETVGEAVQILNYITDEIAAASAVYDAQDFYIHPDYRNTMGFVLKTPVGANNKYVFYSLRGSRLFRVAFHFSESDPAKISFGSLQDGGVNAISDEIDNIDGSGLDLSKKLVHVQFESGIGNGGGSFGTRIYSKGAEDL